MRRGGLSVFSYVPGVTFMPPALPRHLVARPHLTARLATGTRLSLVTGPPGAGKSTLVRSWLDTVQRPWAWMTVDGSFVHPEQFWVGFTRAVQVALPGAVLDAADVIGVEAPDPALVAATLVDDLLDVPVERGPVVVVDDAHLLDAATWRSIEWLVNHQPPSLHLVVISRSDPPFSIARFRSLGWTTEVRQHDLAMSRDETAALVAITTGSADMGAVSDVLHARTEGWAAGIRLALLAIEQGDDADTALGPDGWPHALVADLLVAEALERQPPDVRRFLEDSAVVDVVEPSLCDALTGRHDSRAVLARLAREHVFIVPLEGPAERYRFHPLFADVLRLRLRTLDPGREAAQHLLASEWFERGNMPAIAVEHALAGGHHERALHLIGSRLADLYAGGHRQAVGRWLLELPDEFVAGDADRAVEHCAALLFVTRPEWARWLRRAQSIVGPDRPDLLARLELFEALGAGGQGHLHEFESHVAHAHELRSPGTTDPFDEVIDAWRVRLLVLHGRPADAAPIANAVFRGPRQMISDLPATSLLAATLHANGDIVAVDLVRDVIGEWRDRGEPLYLGMADALVVAADTARRHGQLEEAEVLATSAVAVTDDRPTHIMGVTAEIALAEVEHAFGRSDEALARLDHLGGRVAKTRAHAAVLDQIAAARRRLSAAAVTARPGPVEHLTERELTILRYLASHLTFPEIGHELFISRHTVKTHVTRIYRKLGVGGRSEAVAVARAVGLLDG